MTLNLPEPEMDALGALSAEKGLSKTVVMRQALRLYRMVDAKNKAGERLFFENGEAKRVEFYVLF